MIPKCLHKTLLSAVELFSRFFLFFSFFVKHLSYIESNGRLVDNSTIFSLRIVYIKKVGKSDIKANKSVELLTRVSMDGVGFSEGG